MMSEIVAKSEDALIVYKPSGILSENDPNDSANIFKMTADTLASLGEKSMLFAVHRLDRAVGGLLIIARNKKSAAELSELAAREKIDKEYLAVIEGVPDKASGTFSDMLTRDKILGKAVLVKAGAKDAKEAELNYELVATKEGKKGVISLVKIRLKTGRFHQIRAQFSIRGMSLVGDKKYGSRDGYAKTPSLFCHNLSVNLFGSRLEGFKLPPCDEYPWSVFAENLEELESFARKR